MAWPLSSHPFKEVGNAPCDTPADTDTSRESTNVTIIFYERTEVCKLVHQDFRVPNYSKLRRTGQVKNFNHSGKPSVSASLSRVHLLNVISRVSNHVSTFEPLFCGRGSLSHPS